MQPEVAKACLPAGAEGLTTLWAAAAAAGEAAGARRAAGRALPQRAPGREPSEGAASALLAAAVGHSGSATKAGAAAEKRTGRQARHWATAVRRPSPVAAAAVHLSQR